MAVTEAELLDPLPLTHVLPDAIGWVKREDIGPRVWQLPDGLLFMFAPGMTQEVLMWGRYVTTIDHEPTPEPPQPRRDQPNGDWPGSKRCDKFFPERGHCAICDGWFDTEK